jgi:hypothetical protein
LLDEAWLKKDRFRITVVSADNSEQVLYRASVDPYYEWNSIYLRIDASGAIERWGGY